MDNQAKRNLQSTMVSDADFGKLAQKLTALLRLKGTDIKYSRVGRDKIPLPQEYFVISKAYNETMQKNEWIETMLLARDYIID